MKKIFLDTNVWMRYFIRTIEDQYQAVLSLLKAIEEGKYLVYTSSIVFLETYFIATKLYKIPEKDVLQWFRNIKKVRGLTLIESTNFYEALELHSKYHVKLADCIIATQIPDKVILVTFDKEFRKIKNFPTLSPQQVLNMVQ